MTVLESILLAAITSFVSSGITAIFGNMKVNSRLNTFELKVAEQYLPKADFNRSREELVVHLQRIEDKLDKFLLDNTNGKESNRG